MSKGMPVWQQRQMVVLCAIIPLGQMLERSDVPREAREAWRRIHKTLRTLSNKIRAAIRPIEREDVPLPAMTELCLYLIGPLRANSAG